MGSLIADSLAKLSEAAAPYLPKLGGKATKLFMSGERSLEFMGVEGLTLKNTIRTGLESRARAIAPHEDEAVKILGSLKKDVVEDIFNQIESKKITSPEAAVLDSKLTSMFNESVNAGVSDAKDAVHNVGYIPKIPVDDAFTGKNKTAALNAIIKGGQATNAVEAEAKLQHMQSGGRIYHNLETRRTISNLPASTWRRDSAIIYDHFNRGYGRIEDVKNWGATDEVLTEQLSQIKAIHGDKAAEHAHWLAEHAIGRSIGRQGPVAGLSRSPWERSISSLMSLTHLSLAGIREAGQFSNIPIVTGQLAPLVKGFSKMLSDSGAAEDNAMRAGVLLYNSQRLAKNEALGRWTLGGKMMQYVWSPIHKANQILGSEAGRESALEYFDNLLKDPKDKIAKHYLNLYGVNAEEALERGALSETDLLTASKRVADWVTTEVTPMSVPPAFLATPLGRTVSLWRTFGAMQTKIVKDSVIKPALGIGGPQNLKPLLYLSIIFPSVGEITNDMSELIRRGNLDRRPDWNKYPFDRIMEDAIYANTFGIFYDTARALSYNNINAFYSFVLGPVMTQAFNSSFTLAKTFTSDKPHPLDNLTETMKEELVSSTLVVGPRLYEEYYAKKHARTKSMFERGVVTKTLEKLLK